MKKFLICCLVFMSSLFCQAQDHPAIAAWLQNTTETGSYYVQGNYTTIDNEILYNCQQVEYSDSFVYVFTNGIPAYPTGPFLDGNPSQASSQDAIYKFPLYPKANASNPDETTGGNIGVFVNGVSLFDYRDGVAWNPNTNNLCGGPGNPMCPGGPMTQMDWNRDAIPAEMDGFDCSKAHPAMGNYHHHQNPSAFKLDLEVVSTICSMYDADGLYTIDPTQHSPLLGFAYDGFPIYGAYGYKNADGTGEITRIKSSYQLKNISTRPNGPDVGATVTTMGPGGGNTETLFLGYFREDYEYIEQSEEDYVDEHNGRFCVTPEYPQGTYAYFATVDENWNSAYPYVVGPTFYGVLENRKVNNINETTTVYISDTSTVQDTTVNALEFVENFSITVYPNPASDLIAIQFNGLVREDIIIELMNVAGRQVKSTKIESGSTIAYFNVQTLYDGLYFLRFSNGKQSLTEKILISKD